MQGACKVEHAKGRQYSVQEKDWPLFGKGNGGLWVGKWAVDNLWMEGWATHAIHEKYEY